MQIYAKQRTIINYKENKTAYVVATFDILYILRKISAYYELCLEMHWFMQKSNSILYSILKGKKCYALKIATPKSMFSWVFIYGKFIFCLYYKLFCSDFYILSVLAKFFENFKFNPICNLSDPNGNFIHQNQYFKWSLDTQCWFSSIFF